MQDFGLHQRPTNFIGKKKYKASDTITYDEDQFDADLTHIW